MSDPSQPGSSSTPPTASKPATPSQPPVSAPASAAVPSEPIAPIPSSTVPSPSSSSAPASSAVNPPKPLEPLTGFRASLEHTGLPRGVLTWKPRLPGRNWLIFWTILGTVSYTYYSDRRKCKEIKEEYTRKVEHFGKEPVQGSLGLVRKVRVLAARWPEDDDTDRGARYFRKYVKPYLVAAGIDYVQTPAPLYGSLTRQVHAEILRLRRQRAGLEAAPPPLTLPGAISPDEVKDNELNSGIVLVGRPSLKEYMEGLRRGWSGGVGEWEWEKDVEKQLAGDGVFEVTKMQSQMPDGFVSDADAGSGVNGVGEAVEEKASSISPIPAPSSSSSKPTVLGGLSFLARPNASPIPSFPTQPTSTSAPQPQQIPEHLHIAPSPLPPQPPILLLPWRNHLGFKQIPYMMYDYFTEHKRVKEGAELAYALICGHTRPFVGPTGSSAGLSSEFQETVAANIGGDATSSSSSSALSIPPFPAPTSDPAVDTSFDLDSERYFKKDFLSLPTRLDKARTDYYAELSRRIDDIRTLASGARQLTDKEKKSSSPLPTEAELQAERLKKELRWKGQVEGWEITRPDSGVRWVEGWEGWLRVYETPKGGDKEGTL